MALSGGTISLADTGQMGDDLAASVDEDSANSSNSKAHSNGAVHWTA